MRPLVEWLESARCRQTDVDPEWFFADKSDERAVSLGFRTCSMCPVIRECKEWTIAQDARPRWRSSIYGIQGGLSAEQRRRIVAGKREEIGK